MDIKELLYLKGLKPSELAYLQSKDELLEMAKMLEIPKRSRMNKEALSISIMDSINGFN